MPRRKKTTEPVVKIAEEIATVVSVAKEEPSVEKVETVEAIEPKKAEKPVSKTRKKKVEPKVAYQSTKVPKKMKVKATQSVRGIFGKMNYEIKAGETYELPTNLANWLISVGRAI